MFEKNLRGKANLSLIVCFERQINKNPFSFDFVYIEMFCKLESSVDQNGNYLIKNV